MHGAGLRGEGPEGRDRGVLQGPGITWGSSSRVVSPLMAAPRCQESRTLLSAILLAAWPSGPGSHTLIM